MRRIHTPQCLVLDSRARQTRSPKQIRLLVSNHPSPLDEQTEANLTVSLNLKAVQGAQGKMVRPSSSSRLDRRLKSEMLIVS
jgi:hypothetical protein